MSVIPLLFLLAPAGPVRSPALRTPVPPTKTPVVVELGGGSRVAWASEKVTLDVKDADLVEVLQALTKARVPNLVVDPEVRGSVTATFADVPWDQALEAVLRGRGYGTRREGNVLRVAPLSRLLATP